MKNFLEKNGNWLFILGIVVFAVFLFIGLQIFITVVFEVEVKDEGVILTLVGILATFVVISNYMQVIEIKRAFDSKVEKLEHSQESIIEKIDEVQDSKKDIDDKIAKLDNDYLKYLRATIKEFDQQENRSHSSRYFSMAEIFHAISIGEDSLDYRNEMFRKCLSYAICAIQHEVKANIANSPTPETMMAWANKIGTEGYEIKIESVRISKDRKKELLDNMKGIPNGSQIPGFMELWKKIDSIETTD